MLIHRNDKPIHVVLLLLAILLASSTAPAGDITSGGGSLQSAEYGFDVSVGQSIAGNVSNSTYGFTVGTLATPVSDISDWICGDVNASGGIDIDDIVYVIAYVFGNGPGPQPTESGDVNCSGFVDIDDVVYLIAYIFQGGQQPCDTNDDGTNDC